MNNTLLPKLRFPEFQDAPEWENPKLEEISVPVVERVGDRKLTPVSISAGIGFVPQAEKFGRDISGNQYRFYTLARDGDFVYNKGNSLKFPQGCVYILRNWGEVAAPNVFICFRLKDGYINNFFQNCFEKNMHGVQLQKHITSGARSNGLLNISKDTFFGIRIPTPSTAEQQKIADCLTSLDDLIAAQSQKVAALQAYKKGLLQNLFPAEGESVPRLRFPEFEDAGEWEEKKMEECLDYQQPTDYLVSDTKYSNSYKTPVLTAGKTFILGYTNEQHGIFSDNLPVIIFDDFTTATQFVDFPFKAKSSAMKILQAKNGANIKFMYEAMQMIAYEVGAHERHWISKFAPMSILIPQPAEQQRIAELLSALDEEIAAQGEALAALKVHKKGLMQGLFVGGDGAR